MLKSFENSKFNSLSFNIKAVIITLQTYYGATAMLSQNEIFKEVQQIFVDISDLVYDDIDIDSDLEMDLDLYELERIELAVVLESRFNITVSDDEVYEFETVGDIVDFVSAKLIEQEA